MIWQSHFSRKTFWLEYTKRFDWIKIGLLYLHVACSWYVEHDFFLPSKYFSSKNEKTEKEYKPLRGGRDTRNVREGKIFSVFMGIVVDNPYFLTNGYEFYGAKILCGIYHICEVLTNIR